MLNVHGWRVQTDVSQRHASRYVAQGVYALSTVDVTLVGR